MGYTYVVIGGVLLANASARKVESRLLRCICAGGATPKDPYRNHSIKCHFSGFLEAIEGNMFHLSTGWSICRCTDWPYVRCDIY
ncbi:hypothetical protein F5B22DRAFT_600922 [Xylaria bambusicola]|uniref:uncharacterized protein n=1 Tax=Xylaria bambusicola TaxID=326684 RepID=UPI002007E29F|nr:uncharacterized protein F5B22DRAFT_600922 [Xylaria bambusicola]KAI0518360.1 hypothetical protein F5B22DRAFT_600922 [Xylaria bambusicola]